MELTDSRLTGAESEQDLIPSIWQRLPDAILDMVLTKLPLSVLKKFCGVSKSWKAFIHSEEFAHRCQSVEPTIFYFSRDSGKPFLAVPNLKTDSWERYFLEFISEDESAELIATSEGLLCYRVLKRTPHDENTTLPNEEVILVVNNPFTRKSRRLIVPYTFNTRDRMLGGLAVNQATESYKVVVAFIENHSPRTTFIYDSGANSWSVSASVSPALLKDFNVDCMGPVVRRSICCDGELYWLVMWVDTVRARHTKMLVKYSIGLDTWSLARHTDMSHYELDLTSFQKRPLMVMFVNSSASIAHRERLLSSWNLPWFDAQDVARLLEAAEGELNRLGLRRTEKGLVSRKTSFRLAGALAETGTWFILYHDLEYEGNVLFLKLEASSVTQLPRSSLDDDVKRLYDRWWLTTLGTFAARLNSFV